ncbi:MAG: ATP-binding protein [Planctomycetota bacterium]
MPLPPEPRPPRWLLLLLPIPVLVLAVGLWLVLSAQPPPTGELILLHGSWEICQDRDDYDQPPGAEADWHGISLPGSVPLEPRRTGLRRWYRHRLQLPARLPDAPLGLYLGPVQAADSAWIDGRRVGATGQVRGDGLAPHRRPRLYPIPADALRPGGVVTVALRIRNTDPGRHGPQGKILAIGSYAQLQRYAQGATLPILAIGWILLGIGLFLLVLWQANRRLAGLGSFALATVLMGLLALLDVWWAMNLPLPLALREFTRHVLYATAPVLFLRFLCHGMITDPSPRLRRLADWLLWYPAFHAAILLAIPAWAWTCFDRVVNDAVIVLLACVTLFLIGRELRRRQPDSVLMAVALGLFALTALVEIADQHLGLDLPRGLHFVGMLILVLGMAVSLARRLYRLHRAGHEVQDRLAALNSQLEQTVEHRTADLAASNRDLATKQEQLSEESARQRELLHVLCHDLANPLSSLSGALELLQADHTQLEDLLPVFDLATTHARRIIDLVRSLRGLEEHSLQLEPVVLREAIDDALVLVGPRARVKHIDIRVAVDPQIAVRAERTSLTSSVIANLLTNAIKFSRHGAAVEVTTTCNDDTVELRVIDHGVGIPDALMGELFILAAATSRPGTDGETGTGFGLPLVRKFVEAYGGDVSVESQTAARPDEPSGTTVIVHLPALSPSE